MWTHKTHTKRVDNGSFQHRGSHNATQQSHLSQEMTQYQNQQQNLNLNINPQNLNLNLNPQNQNQNRNLNLEQVTSQSMTS